MPDIKWNKSTWDGSYNWESHGEEWSAPWGNSSAEWYGTILPRIGSALPCKTILEIAPGFGRWSNYLNKYCNEYYGIDLSNACVQACRKKYPGLTFIQNDGKSLLPVSNIKFDFVFSFDSLVHADLDAIGEYIPQIINILTPSGLSFIHHSNLGFFDSISYGHRSENVSYKNVKALIEKFGGYVHCQELISWGDVSSSDCFTLFSLANEYPKPEYILLDNASFGTEARIAKEIFLNYHRST